MAETKITIFDKLTMIEEIAVGTPNEAIILEYCANEKAKLDNKKAKAAARAQAKKEAGDDLRACIQSILEGATEPMTREMVLDCIEDAEAMELTAAKVGARISQLVQLGLASKTTVKVDDKNKVAYVWGTTDAE